MKNIRHRYVFQFTGRSVDSRIEVKGENLKGIYHQLMWWEPVLEDLRDRSVTCRVWEYHKGRNNGYWLIRKHDGGFLPCNILSDKDYNYLLRHGI